MTTKKDMLAAYARIIEGRRKGGAAKTAAKARAAQANGRRGGAPPTRPRAVRLAEIHKRIEAGLPISPAQAALHYADKMGASKARTWALHQRQRATTEGAETSWWDAVAAQLQRGVR